MVGTHPGQTGRGEPAERDGYDRLGMTGPHDSISRFEMPLRSGGSSTQPQKFGPLRQPAAES